MYHYQKPLHILAHKCRKHLVFHVYFRCAKPTETHKRCYLSREMLIMNIYGSAVQLRKNIGSPENPLQGGSIQVCLLTDSKFLFDIIDKGSRSSEKRLMIDVVTTRKGYHSE